MHSVAIASLRALAPVVYKLKYYILPIYRNMAGTAVNINFNPRHLKKGDPLPPYNGKLRIYNMRYCPFAHRTVLVLLAKSLDFEIVNVDLMDKPEWLTSKSLFGKVPALEIEEGVCIAESLVTSEYLDEVYPQRPLLPKDPLKKALTKIIIEATGPIQQIFMKLLKFPDTITEDHWTAYYKALTFVEDQLKDSSTPFIGGTEPGFADYMIWPWFERVTSYSKQNGLATIDPSKYKILSEYISNMFKDPAVSQYLVPDEVLFKLFEGYKPGNKPDYNLLTQE